MATLSEPVKIYIVQSLACMISPQKVAEAVKQEYGLDIDRKQVQLYDPTKAAGKNLSKKFVELFHKTRQEFRENIVDIPLANKAYRLRELQDMYDSAGKNKVVRQSLIKQAFQETDGRVTRQEVTGKDGQPLHPAAQPQYTPEQLANLSTDELSRLCLDGKI